MFKFFEQLTPIFYKGKDKLPNPKLLDFCVHYLSGYWHVVAMISVLTVCSAMSEAVLYWFMGRLIDFMQANNEHRELSSSFIGFAVFIVIIVVPVTNFLRSFLINQSMMANFPSSIRAQMCRSLLFKDMSFFRTRSGGLLAHILMETPAAVRESVLRTIDVILFIGVYICMMLILVGDCDPRLLSPFVGWLILYSAIIWYALPRSKGLSTRHARNQSELSAELVNIYQNMATIRVYCSEEHEASRCASIMEPFVSSFRKLMRHSTIVNAVLWIVNMLLVFATGALGLYLWSNQSLTPGSIAIALGLAIRMTGMSHWIMWEISNVFEKFGQTHNGIATLCVENIDDAASRVYPQAKSAGLIEFDNVHFSYGNNRVLSGLSLQITPGEKLGIVGLSGAGKSTLVGLLLGFHKIDEGSLTLDGQDIRSLDRQYLRNEIAAVFQQSNLLNRSIRENLLLGAEGIPDRAIVEVCKRIDCHDFIESYKDNQGRVGYDAVVSEEGATLSGGQKQRLAIARATLRNPTILILDEATAALDPKTEKRVLTELCDIRAGQGMIFITHRLATLESMDRIVVLQDGCIVDAGTHSELLKKSDIYSKLWTSGQVTSEHK